METSNEMHRTPWRPLTAIGVAAGLLLSGCAADNGEGESPDPRATSISEQEPDKTQPEAPVDNGDNSTEKLWANIGEILDNPNTPQPKGGTYAEFANKYLTQEVGSDTTITVGGEKLDYDAISQRADGQTSRLFDSEREAIFSAFAPDIEQWVATSKYIPEDMPPHVAVHLALDIAAEGLAPNFAGTHVPHESLVGTGSILLSNPAGPVGASNNGYTIDLEKYTQFYADARYNLWQVGEQPPTIEEWQGGQVDSNIDPVTEPAAQSEPALEPGSLAGDISTVAKTVTPDPANTVNLNGLVYDCEDLLGSCNEADQKMLAAVEEHVAELRKAGVEDIISVPVAFLMMRAVDQEFVENYDAGQIINHLITPVNDTAIPISVEDFEVYTVGQHLGLWNYPKLTGDDLSSR